MSCEFHGDSTCTCPGPVADEIASLRFQLSEAQSQLRQLGICDAWNGTGGTACGTCYECLAANALHATNRAVGEAAKLLADESRDARAIHLDLIAANKEIERLKAELSASKEVSEVRLALLQEVSLERNQWRDACRALEQKISLEPKP